MNSNYKREIEAMLKESEESMKKQITISLEERTIDELDMISKKFGRINKKKSFSRNSLIESAVNLFIHESNEIIGNYNISEDIDDYENEDEIDLVILSSKEVKGGFVDTFLGERKWYPLRIKEENRSKVRYIAIYRGTPMSCITHYAEIEKIGYDSSVGEDVFFLKGEPTELPHKITLGNKCGYHFRAPRYLTLNKLLSAKTADDLF